MFVEADARLVIQKCLSSPASPHTSTCPRCPTSALANVSARPTGGNSCAPLPDERAVCVLCCRVGGVSGRWHTTPPAPHAVHRKKVEDFCASGSPIAKGLMAFSDAHKLSEKKQEQGGWKSLTQRTGSVAAMGLALIIERRDSEIKEADARAATLAALTQHVEICGNSVVGAVHAPCGSAYASKPDKHIMKQGHFELLVQVIEDIKNDALSCAMVFGRGVVVAQVGVLKIAEAINASWAGKLEIITTALCLEGGNQVGTAESMAFYV